MPLIIVEAVEGSFTADQKTRIAQRLTDALVGAVGEGARSRTHCVIDEVRRGEWAVRAALTYPA